MSHVLSAVTHIWAWYREQSESADTSLETLRAIAGIVIVSLQQVQQPTCEIRNGLSMQDILPFGDSLTGCLQRTKYARSERLPQIRILKYGTAKPTD